MRKFVYQAKDSQGKKIVGIVEAREESQAAKLIQAKKLFVISIKPKKEAPFSRLNFFDRVSMDDRVSFTRQLSTMIASGLALTEALAILESQTRPSMSKIVSEILTEIEGGESLASSLEKHPQVFDKIYVSLVKAGETAGILDKILDRLAENLEKQRGFQSKIKGAMIYPLIVLVGMGVVGLILFIFVIPRITVLYEEFQADLPIVTKVFLSISQLISRIWWLGGLLIAFVIFGLPILKRQPEFKKKFDEFFFRIPLFGKLRKQMMLTEFTRTLGLLIEAGILVIDALNVVKDSLDSPAYADAIDQVGEQVEKGFPFAYALAQVEVFPSALPQMVAVGEETGKLGEVLQKVSNYFEQESEVLVKGLTSALEPLIIIVLGIGVTFLVVAVIMPVYNLTSQL